MDNTMTHNCSGMQQYLDGKEKLVIINLPTYSPDLNPQENIWNRLKNCIFSSRARANIEELFNYIVSIYEKLNQNKSIENLTYARNYYA
ncbi:transposase [Clostridium beijerinckii]|uniref:Transposase n=1 Tax=Clostridium beijerinckii TaxID=1520 RepID=A0AAE5LNI8_CLOBE|nr:transposase [Clostridium beijerinckii]NSB12629.1 transposase [Clostridium beijerinckii]